MKEQSRISVVIPVYNASGNLAKLQTEILKCAKENDYYIEVIYVDDYSSDNS